jgi:hypothetical protein
LFCTRAGVVAKKKNWGRQVCAVHTTRLR